MHGRCEHSPSPNRVRKPCSRTFSNVLISSSLQRTGFLRRATMDDKSAKPRRMGNHYIPPPARKQGFETNESTRQKERPMKTCENRGVKLCNDSSLLFKESNEKVKERTRRSRRSKRTAKKSDVENAVQSENHVTEPKSSSAASGLTDRIINYQSDQSIDSAVLVERPNAKVVLSLLDLENMKPRHPVELTGTIGSGEADDHNNLLNPLHHGDQDTTEETPVVGNLLQPLEMFPPSDLGDIEEAENEPERLDVELDSIHHEDMEDIPDKEENPPPSIEPRQSCDLITNRLDEENQITSLTFDDTSEKPSSLDPAFSIIEEDSSNLYADWDSIYDDRGECLLPSAGSVKYSPEVVKNSVQLKSPDSKKGDDDDQPHETSSIIEIYGFSEDLKTNDILNAFGNWNQRGFNLKWVDNTHALGIFPTPALAEEVLSSNIPIVKIRPISQGTALSQERARTLVLPSSLRPKTCTALARRLVSGALGLRVNVTPEERAAERELLREAREKKKLVLKQRDAAWEGNFSSLECSEEKASN
ncbi:hypothetical protein GE061_000853 [Apolygus lucorum]|uniref:Uncharacterized protein n=1 Tax=Apolygus lucorum TaxID=248454 RepID=A0A8S9Y7D8_APOLU|nr:hypothetical protein GE061_000853 [Apolygus lucorum]